MMKPGIVLLITKANGRRGVGLPLGRRSFLPFFLSGVAFCISGISGFGTGSIRYPAFFWQWS